MTGSWHVYRERERWKKPAYLARVVVGSDSGWLGVCFQAPVVETYRRGGGEPQVLLDLGPDLCLADSLVPAVLDQVVARTHAIGDRAASLGEALLDQRIAAGIGNVYKSEACFACRLDPTAPLAAFDDAARRRVWEVAARQLQANLDRPGRRTHPQGLAVYGRRGQPCPACGTPVAMDRHGDLARSTYWCPRCQTS
jgi:endonuclease-8